MGPLNHGHCCWRCPIVAVVVSAVLLPVTALTHSRSRPASTIEMKVTRRGLLPQIATAVGVASAVPGVAEATITSDSMWPLWLALPVAPYSRRKTIRREVGPGVWTFDQLIGIYYVHVPIRMTVIKMESGGGGLMVFAPVAPTKECLGGCVVY